MLIERIDPATDPRYPLERELRYRVLRAPLGMGRAQVGFAGEERALHYVAWQPGTPESLAGCVLFDFQSGRLRAMAVDPAHQKQGLGARLVRALEDDLRGRGILDVSLHARAGVSGFYARLGYRAVGEPFVEVGLPHVIMVKRLSS